MKNQTGMSKNKLDIIKEPRTRGAGRTTREDWINVALDTLVSDGIENVKVLSIAEKLNCARSSFYWFFSNRADLLTNLLDYWQKKNTGALIDSAQLPAESIHFALCNVFSCWIGQSDFDIQLDFAIRDWARRSGPVRRALDISDAARIKALSIMFKKFGYQKSEAETRARILYFTQIGYDFVDQQEGWETRYARAGEYLYCLTGVVPGKAEITAMCNATPGPMAIT